MTESAYKIGFVDNYGTGAMMDLSVIIPVYRSEKILEKLYARLITVLEANTQDFEIIFVEDCGGDNSWRVITELAEKDDRVKGLKLNRNFGQHNAILCGIREACYPLTVTMDDDLQHPPEEIPILLEHLDDDSDVIYGTPKREQHGFLRDIASILTKLVLQNLMGARIARNVSAFRLFRTHLREAFDTYHSSVVSIDALLTWSTDRYTAVQTEHVARTEGQSGYGFFKLLILAFNLMTSFTVLPLRFASMVGGLFIFFGICILTWVLVNYFVSVDERAPGFSFLASIIAIFSGVQLFTLGILGEYLARIHNKTMNKPSYIVKYKTSDKT
jgi:undecaprenyl-phosphate 4-deoxy-4-formamido-L-arabinose transferase